jgi:DNA-binding IscR family transcriptional regulator
MLHVLLHMARHDRPYTSEQIAGMLQTNAVVVRRTMAGLRASGYVQSVTGQGGGWTTLLDIHRAVGGRHIFAIGLDNDNPSCAVERVVNGAVADALSRAERLLIGRLGEITLAELAEQFDAICRAELKQ